MATSVWKSCVVSVFRVLLVKVDTAQKLDLSSRMVIGLAEDTSSEGKTRKTASQMPSSSSYLSRTTWVSQKGRTILDLNEARDDGWQWYQLDHMQIICISLKTDNNISTLSLNFCRPGALPDTQTNSVKAVKAQTVSQI